jgi:CBS domain-containing membrane protein
MSKNWIESATVADIMSRSPLTVEPADDVTTALDVMRTHKIRHVPVVADDGEVLGILSERDLLSSPVVAVAREDEDGFDETGEALRPVKVDEVYTRSPETIDEDAPLADAARVLLENKFGCLPVMRGSELVGILTESDFIKLVLRELEAAGSDEAERSLEAEL